MWTAASLRGERLTTRNEQLIYDGQPSVSGSRKLRGISSEANDLPAENSSNSVANLAHSKRVIGLPDRQNFTNLAFHARCK